MRTIAQALAPYTLGQQRPALPHQHCIDEDAVENGLIAISQDLRNARLLRPAQDRSIREFISESFWDGVDEWRDAK